MIVTFSNSIQNSAGDRLQKRAMEILEKQPKQDKRGRELPRIVSFGEALGYAMDEDHALSLEYAEEIRTGRNGSPPAEHAESMRKGSERSGNNSAGERLKKRVKEILENPPEHNNCGQDLPKTLSFSEAFEIAQQENPALALEYAKEIRR